MHYETIKEIAKLWGVKETQISYYCRKGDLKGCKKEKGEWLIPSDVKKPTSLKKKENPVLLPLPIGISDFKEMVKNYYYIDKTLMIKDIIDTLPKVSLFTRPRRFGKTLNMSMLKAFFEKDEKEDTSIYFKDKLIWTAGKKYQDYQGKYPVIFLTFKDVKFDSYEEALKSLSWLIRDEFLRHQELIGKNSSLNPAEKDFYSIISNGEGDEVELAISLEKLSKFLNDYYRTPAVIIIDEYDTPIQEGHLKGYYDKVIAFMRNLFSGAFKDNPNLAFGFMTGILRVAKESIFSGMNNLKENSILTNRYSEYFGFTKVEVCSLLKYYGHSKKVEEVCDWYDGYRFGKSEIFNPWSVLNYVDEGCKVSPYWQSTGNNVIIKELIAESSETVKSMLQTLLEGGRVCASIDTSITYPEIHSNPLSVFSFLLTEGYLKVEENSSLSPKALCELKIPNKEIRTIYGDEILSSLKDSEMQSSAYLIQNAILNQNAEVLKKEIVNFLKQSISVYDSGSESFYQGLMIGIYATMNNLYQVLSNRESGDGRFDIQMCPIDIKKNQTGILIELKVLSKEKDNLQEELLHLSKKALEQIDQKNYKQVLINSGIKHILKYGIAFFKKTAEVSFEEENV